jgi:acid phosphatase family membrane protein YuiD
MDAITSPYLIAIVLAWVIAQGLKYVFAVVRTHDMTNLRQLYLSGNMPSAHSAGVTALATVVGLRDGFGTALFGIAFLFAAVVMYDAVMVRRSSGEQGIAIQKLIKLSKADIALPRAAKGHTPAEVLVGIVLGIIIGLVVFFATK